MLWCTDPMEDQFEKRLKTKNEAVAKNELQRLRNIARNMKGRGTSCVLLSVSVSTCLEILSCYSLLSGYHINDGFQPHAPLIPLLVS